MGQSFFSHSYLVGGEFSSDHLKPVGGRDVFSKSVSFISNHYVKITLVKRLHKTRNKNRGTET